MWKQLCTHLHEGVMWVVIPESQNLKFKILNPRELKIKILNPKEAGESQIPRIISCKSQTGKLTNRKFLKFPTLPPFPCMSMSIPGP